MITVRFTEAGSALAAAHAMHRSVFDAGLPLCGEDPEAFPVALVLETFFPDTGHKLRTRQATLTDMLWPKVVDRTLSALGDDESGWPRGVSLVPGRPFDDRHLADEMPPAYPKSYLKGVQGGPITISFNAFPGEGGSVLEISLRGKSDDDIDESDEWDLAVVALAAAPTFELAAIRTGAYGGSESFSTDPDDRPVVLVCGPALADARRAELEASATAVREGGSIRGLEFLPVDRR